MGVTRQWILYWYCDQWFSVYGCCIDYSKLKLNLFHSGPGSVAVVYCWALGHAELKLRLIEGSSLTQLKLSTGVKATTAHAQCLCLTSSGSKKHGGRFRMTCMFRFNSGVRIPEVEISCCTLKQNVLLYSCMGRTETLMTHEIHYSDFSCKIVARASCPSRNTAFDWKPLAFWLDVCVDISIVAYKFRIVKFQSVSVKASVCCMMLVNLQYWCGTWRWVIWMPSKRSPQGTELLYEVNWSRREAISLLICTGGNYSRNWNHLQLWWEKL